MEPPQASFPNLLCEENESSLKQKRDEKHGFCSISQSDCEFVEMLFECEISFLPNNDDVSSVWKERCWFESVRDDVIKWILQKMDQFGYHHRTAYLSMIYFDRFLTRMPISDGKLLKIQILSIACLSLAAKMDECQLRPLRDYTLQGYQFLESSIQKMELIVLDTLEWRMCCVTPFAFLNYFAAKFCVELTDQEPTMVRANQLILAMMEDVDVAKHRPSIIAAAAVLAAYDNHLTEAALASKIDALPSWGSVEKEHTVSCYNLVQEIMGLGTPESIVSQNSLNRNVVENSTNIFRGTRRRLSFDNCDHDFPPQKISRSCKE